MWTTIIFASVIYLFALAPHSLKLSRSIVDLIESKNKESHASSIDHSRPSLTSIYIQNAVRSSFAFVRAKA